MLVAICIVVTSIVVPILTGLWSRRFGQGMADRAQGMAGRRDLLRSPFGGIFDRHCKSSRTFGSRRRIKAKHFSVGPTAACELDIHIIFVLQPVELVSNCFSPLQA